MSCTSETAHGNGTSETQESELVLTFSGLIHELDSVFKDRSIPMLVTANSPTLLPWKDALKRLRVKGFVLPELPQGGSSTAEQIDTGFNYKRYLVVGVIPCRKSLHTNESGALSIFDDTSNDYFFIRVVTPIQDETAYYEPNFYALIDAEPNAQL